MSSKTMPNRKSMVLLLVDIQHDYLNTPSLEPHAGSITGQAVQLLKAARDNAIPVIHVWTTVSRERDNRMPHWKDSDTWRCVEYTDGHLTPDVLNPIPGEAIVHKTFFSAFSSDVLDRELAAYNPSVLVLAGLYLHACVRATALDAYQRGFETWIAYDATGSDDPLHAVITKRYLQKRSSVFLSSSDIVGSFAKSTGSTEPPATVRQSLLLTSPGEPEKRWCVSISTAQEIGKCVQGARSAAVRHNAMAVEDLVAAIDRVRDGLRSVGTELARCLVEEIGKPVEFARQEIEASCRMLEKIAARTMAEQSYADSDPQIRHRPIGTVAIISPWNNPVYIPLGKIIPALVYGNTVVWKPAEAATKAAAIVHKLLVDAFPRDTVAVATGDGTTGAGLINSPGVDAVSFTGSLTTGRAIQEICAARLLPLQAELGGNNAVIVAADADMTMAAKETVRGAFALAGQRCTATRRAIVMRPALSGFVELLRAAASEMTWGDPMHESVQIGPLISVRHKKNVQDAVHRARQDGCRVEHLAPKVLFDDEAQTHCYFPPTLLFCDVSTHEIVQEELFAPVLVIQVVDSLDEAITRCNAVRQGLVASIFSVSQNTIASFLDEAKAGILKVNKATDGAAVDAPFGGWKASGIGPAEHGECDREFYTRFQTIYR